MDEKSVASRVPDRCPACDEALLVTRLTCANCATEVSGRFQTTGLEHLRPEDLHFVLLFVRRKGNLKEMERDLGISYWTIRRRLDEIVDRLEPAGQQPAEQVTERHQAAVLRRLKQGEIDPESALELLRAARGQVKAQSGKEPT